MVTARCLAYPQTMKDRASQQPFDFSSSARGLSPVQPPKERFLLLLCKISSMTRTVQSISSVMIIPRSGRGASRAKGPQYGGRLEAALPTLLLFPPTCSLARTMFVPPLPSTRSLQQWLQSNAIVAKESSALNALPPPDHAILRLSNSSTNVFLERVPVSRAAIDDTPPATAASTGTFTPE